MDKAMEPTVLFGKSKWIWTADADKKNSNIILRRTFSFGQGKPPARAVCRIACNTHYCMFVNGNAVVWYGGLDRSGDRAFYDEIDIAKHLVKGDNAIVVYCKYYGNSGRDLVDAPHAGFIFECHDLEIYSDKSFTAYENVAYKAPQSTNCCYAGWGVNYDAALEGQIQNVLDPLFSSSQFAPAFEHGCYPDERYGTLEPRPLPLERFSTQRVFGKYKKLTDQFEGDRYVMPLPREMRVTPYMEVAGNGQETITITTDRTECGGGFGEESSVYKAHFVMYMTKPTLNVYEGMLPMVGNALIFTMPRSVKVIKLGYRELGYGTTRTCDFDTDDDKLCALYEKAINTLYCCMGSTLIDTPERERTMWLGDASIASRALFLTYYDAAPLVKKVISDVLDNSDGDVLYSGVPGGIPADIPSHGLLALGERGLFANYLDFVGDVELFRARYEQLCSYVMLWDMTEHGVALRDGMRRWYDNLYNIDEALVENAMYYSACKFLKRVGKLVGNYDYDETFDDRMDNIAEYVESCWDGMGYTSRDGGYDDRANALITLAGLVPDDRKDGVARLLSATVCASPYMEWAVIEALVKLGRGDLARKRFDSRYATAAESEQTTLGEDYNGYGSGCQSYQAAVATEIIAMFGGIVVRDGGTRINITPDFRAIKDMRLSLKTASGELEVRYKYSPTRIDILVDNRTSAKVELDILPENIGRAVERRTITLNKGKNKFTV